MPTRTRRRSPLRGAPRRLLASLPRGANCSPRGAAPLRAPQASEDHADAPRTARVFYALVPDPALQAELGGLARDLARRTEGRALPDENIHLTVAFVGDVAETALDALQALLPALPGRAFALDLDTLGAFRHADLAWIAPSNAPPALAELQAALAAALRDAGFAIDERPFRPHLTLVRHCRRRPPASTPYAPLHWRVCALSLMRSEAAARGVRYRELARRELTA